MEAKQQYVKQIKDQQTPTCQGRNKSTHLVREERKKNFEVAPKVQARQINILSKPSSGRRYMRDRVMCEGAKKLTPEEMAALEIDIFEPLDFYEILFNRTKESSKERIISSLNEL